MKEKDREREKDKDKSVKSKNNGGNQSDGERGGKRKGKAVKKRRRKEFNNPDAPSNKGRGDRTLLVRKYRRSNIPGQKPKKQANPSLRGGKEKLCPNAKKKSKSFYIVKFIFLITKIERR